MYQYIVPIIIAIIAIYLYFSSKKPTKRLPKTGKGLPKWTFPFRPDPTDKSGGISIFNVSADTVNKEVVTHLQQQYPDKTPILTKSLIKDKQTILQLTIFDDNTMISINNATGDIGNIELTSSELETIKQLKSDMEQNPIKCTPDVGASYPMTFVTLHNPDETKTYYADGSCLASTLTSYRKLNEILNTKLQ